jgi:hypothetical protein
VAELSASPRWSCSCSHWSDSLRRCGAGARIRALTSAPRHQPAGVESSADGHGRRQFSLERDEGSTGQRRRSLRLAGDVEPPSGHGRRTGCDAAGCAGRRALVPAPAAAARSRGRAGRTRIARAGCSWRPRPRRRLGCDRGCGAIVTTPPDESGRYTESLSRTFSAFDDHERRAGPPAPSDALPSPTRRASRLPSRDSRGLCLLGAAPTRRRRAAATRASPRPGRPRRRRVRRRAAARGSWPPPAR